MSAHLPNSKRRAIALHQEPLFWLFMFLALLWTVAVYKSDLLLTGPFIFGDELTYFSFARHLFYGKNIDAFSQYGPLYPVLISSFFSAASLVQTYQLIKLFNIIFNLSAVIPAYLIAKALFKDKSLQWLLPACVLVSPFGGYVHIIWAEPLYIALFYWTCLMVVQFFKKTHLVYGFLLSLMLASLYYTKPAAGLVIQMATFFTLVIYMGSLKGAVQAKGRLKPFLLPGFVILSSLLLDLPWALHYYNLGYSVIGYPQATQELSIHVNQLGYLTLLWRMLCSSFYQFSYIFVGTWGLIGVFVALLVLVWRYLSESERYFGLFLFFCVCGLIALSALGMSTNRFLDYRMPNGRYFSILFPLVITMTCQLFLKGKMQKDVSSHTLVAVIYVTTIIAFLAPSVYTMNPVAYTSMSELSVIIYLVNHGLVLFGPLIQEPGLWMRFSVAFFFGGFAYCILLYLRRLGSLQPIALVIFIGTLLSALAAHYYVVKLGQTQSYLNNLYVTLLNHNIDATKVMFDKKLEGGNVQFMTPFWFNTEATYGLEDEVRNNLTHHSPLYFVSMDQIALPCLYCAKIGAVYKVDEHI